MSDYIKITDYAAKDNLLTGNPAKLVKGSEIGADFDAVAVAVATKYDATDVGVSIQAYSANLDEYAAVNPTAAGLALLDDATASDQLTTLGVSAFAKTILDDADEATFKATVNLEIGVDVQAYDATILKSANIGSTVQAYDADTAKLDVEQAWSAQQTAFDGTLTDGATIDWNGDSNGQIVSVTLGGNRTLNAPTNINENALYVLTVIQDGTGGRTLGWNAAYKFPGGTVPTVTATAGAVDVFSFIGGAGNTLRSFGQDVK